MQELLGHFPGSTWLIAQAALAQYNLRNFDESQALYEDLVERDPYRIEVHTAAVRGVQTGRSALQHGARRRLAALLEHGTYHNPMQPADLLHSLHRLTAVACSRARAASVSGPSQGIPCTPIRTADQPLCSAPWFAAALQLRHGQRSTQGARARRVWGLGVGGHPQVLLQRSKHCLSPEPPASCAP